MRVRLRCFIAGIGILANMLLAGCGAEGLDTGGAEEVIELHEPGGTGLVATEPVTRRNLYKASTYEGAVYPYVEEYSFQQDQYFGSYGAMLGDTVQKGEVLVYTDEDSFSEEIETLEKKLKSLTEEYEKFRSETEETLQTQRRELEGLERILENLEAEEPEKYISAGEGEASGGAVGSEGEEAQEGTSPDPESGDAGEAETGDEGELIVNPAYTSWQSEYIKWEGDYKRKGQDISVNEEALRQRQALYKLDYGYYNGLLQEVLKQKREGVIVSQISGVVVDQAFYARGIRVSKADNVIAVADMEQKYLKCDSMPNYLLANAADVYAFAGGKRFEVEYLETGNDIAVFSLQDEADALSAGDYAVLVLVTDYREQVLTVHESSIFTEGTESVVYVETDGESVARTVKTGMSDGVYTEILSGLEEGERVVSQEHKAGANVAVLERKDREVSYAGTGYLYFPTGISVRNPVKYGTAVFEGTEIQRGQYVEKGDVLFQIHVEEDSLDVASRDIALRRAKERLADLEAKGREEDAEAIAAAKEQIAGQEETYAPIKADSERTEIRSEISGIVEYISDMKPGEEIEAGSFLARVSDSSIAYLYLDTSNNKSLNYGDVLTVSYEDINGGKQTIECRCLTLGRMNTGSVYEDMMFLALPEDMVENMPRTEKSNNNIDKLYKAEGFVGRMENVVLVPVNAVTETAGRTYVDVLGEDGSVTPVAFLAGGKDKDYYWAVEGLTEGMKICWD